MNGESRNSTFARIGRSYPRPSISGTSAAPRARFGRYRVAGALIAFLSALGFIGWLLAR
jgi:hypothetical protein